MKKVFSKKYIPLLGLIMLLPACSPETFEKENPDVTADDLIEGLAYTITPDASNPNLIHLESKMDKKYTPLWEHPMGRSQDSKVTLKMAFEGTYEVKFGVMTRGGAVYGDPATFDISEFHAAFVTGDMWDMLAGGAGNSKTWVPDNGNYGKKQGFYSCYDPSATYEDMVDDDGKGNWYPTGKTWWEPSNGDIGITEDDLNSFMTFSLEGKAGLKSHRYVNGQETVTEGLYNMNTDDHTISAIDVDFIYGEWATGKAVDFRTGFQILVLTEDQLMIANYRDEALSGEGRCIYCWNFVSKDYADNYVPVVEDPTPSLPDGWMDEVSQIVTTTLTWKLSSSSPFDWCNPDGSRKNYFSSYDDYPNDAKPANYVSDIAISLRSASNEYTLSLPDGSEIEGSYSMDADGFYTFDNGLSRYLIGGNNIFFGTADNNTLRLLGYEKKGTSVSELWFGIPEYNSEGKVSQYLAFHFEIETDTPVEVTYAALMQYFNTGWTFYGSNDVLISKEGNYTFTLSGSDSDPYGIFLDVYGVLADHPNTFLKIESITVDGNNIPFDDDAIDRGTGDDPTTSRRYILNPWMDPPAFENPGAFAFGESIEVVINITFND